MSGTLPDSDLYLTLLVLGRWSLMPELLDFLGNDAGELLRFIDIFGGTILEVPDRREIGRMARNVHIFRSLRQSDTPQAKEHLAEFYELTVRRVEQIYEEAVVEIKALDHDTGVDIFKSGLV